MPKKNRNKNLHSKKREPRVVLKKKREKASWRNSWITSLIVIVLITILSVIWYISTSNDSAFKSKFDIFTCELPNDWESHDLDSTVQFDGNLGNCSHPHLFSPKGVTLGSDLTTQEIMLNPEQIKALAESMDDPTSEQDKQVKEQISKSISQQENPKSQEEIIREMESVTALTFAIFLPDSDPNLLNQYVNGIGGFDDPHEFFLEELETVGNKIPNVDYGYYMIRAGGHPVGILKKNGATVIINGIVSENRYEDTEKIFQSIRMP